jgi:glycopeptide antibiotics resistance protein
MGTIAGNIIAAIPIVQLDTNIATAMGFSVIMASIMSGCSMEKSQAITEIKTTETDIVF